MIQKGVLTRVSSVVPLWRTGTFPLGRRRNAPGSQTRIWYSSMAFLIWLALPPFCRILHGGTLTSVPWWVASLSSKFCVKRKLASRCSSHLLLGFFVPWLLLRRVHETCCWERPGGRTSIGSGTLPRSGMNSTGSSDLALETLFWLSSEAVLPETLVLVWWWSAMLWW